jgi:positive regulator of sigma E activity
MDRDSLRMAVLTYPLLLVVDVLVLQAVAPGLWVAQAVHALLGVALFVWLLRAYRAKKADAPAD